MASAVCVFNVLTSPSIAVNSVLASFNCCFKDKDIYSRYEGSASNVLRDILLTSSSMIQEITSTRIILLESLKQDKKLVNTLVEDNKLISEYMKELFIMEEIEKNYMEQFIKVVENIKKNNQFVTKLKNIDTVVDEE